MIDQNVDINIVFKCTYFYNIVHICKSLQTNAK